MLKKYLLIFFLSLSTTIFWIEFAYCEIVSSSTTTSVDRNSPEYKARSLEEKKAQIDYCLANIGKKYSELDENKAGTFWPYKYEIDVLTYMLIAQKYTDYGDGGKAGDYYYLNYLHYHTPQTDETRWPWPTGESDDPFLAAIAAWDGVGEFKQLAKYYGDYIVHVYSPLKAGPREAKIETIKKEYPHWDIERQKSYDLAWKKLEKYKKLAKITKPKPLDPAVQNHEWFYSDKQVEVLKALEYYHANKVNFMLEKALKHKDPVISAKAKEYLESLSKGAGDVLEKALEHKDPAIAAKAREYLDNPVKAKETSGDETKK